ncbi:DUF1631 family protein [Ketobacter sp.]|uniref:DUF1631 family protein n=1 Tax=Ketobacter sp. TaxID=2083498 RepID=UPI000F2714EF|nr:DUF1631 family protein [Ketobacter sp.]RLT99308.1 MAG: DUF1631 family protein [Ketobacter sp.]
MAPIMAPMPAPETGRIGARLLVELLRVNAEVPITDKIRLTPQRSRHGLAVFNDLLQKIQSGQLKTGLSCRVVDTLVDGCADLEVALPVAAPDWGGILLLDQLFDELQQQLASDHEARGWFEKLRLLVLRYALADYSFFFAPQNLLRRFLNLAYLTMLSSTAKSRQLYWSKLNEYSNRMLTEFRGNIGAVNSICIEAQTWMAGQTEQVEKIEERLRLLEVARQRERVAEPRVVQELNRMAAGRLLPEDVVAFLHGEWRRSMLMLSMREGVEGANWKRQLRTGESLIEMCEGCQDASRRDGYRGFYQVLIRNLRATLISVQEDEAALEQTLEPLELILTAIMSGATPALVEVPALAMPVTRVVEAQLDRVSPKSLDTIGQLQEEDWLRFKTADGQFELCKIILKAQQDDPWVLVGQSGKTVAKKTQRQLAQALEGGVLQLVHRTLYWDRQLEAALARLKDQWQAQQEAQRKQQETQQQEALEQQRSAAAEAESRIDAVLANSSLALVEPGADDVETEAETSAFLEPRSISDEEMAAALSAVDSLQVGGWMSQETSEGEQRCKLAVKIRATEKLVFVNRLGIKALEITRQDLARLLVYGAVTILDTGAAFDSTLEQVVRTIQRDKQ